MTREAKTVCESIITEHDSITVTIIFNSILKEIKLATTSVYEMLHTIYRIFPPGMHISPKIKMFMCRYIWCYIVWNNNLFTIFKVRCLKPFWNKVIMRILYNLQCVVICQTHNNVWLVHWGCFSWWWSSQVIWPSWHVFLMLLATEAWHLSSKNFPLWWFLIMQGKSGGSRNASSYTSFIVALR